MEGYLVCLPPRLDSFIPHPRFRLILFLLHTRFLPFVCFARPVGGVPPSSLPPPGPSSPLPIVSQAGGSQGLRTGSELLLWNRKSREVLGPGTVEKAILGLWALS